MIKYPFNFEFIQGRFIERKNRFVLTAEVDSKIVDCYLPNPGRLWELLIPHETKLLLLENHDSERIPFTTIFCKKKNEWVLIHTHLTNKIVKALIEQKMIKSLNNYRLVAEEVQANRSRFDFLLSDGNREMFLEIKTCTLFGQRVAMFPDAQTTRGRRHLEELSQLVKKDTKASVLFAVMNPRVEFFLPAYHIDYEFSKAFIEVKDVVEFKAIALEWDRTLRNVSSIREIEIPFDYIEKAVCDRGVYLLVISMEKAENISIGQLGGVHFNQGYYVYIGKAKNDIFKRINRHKRKRKKIHWHIDYLLTKARVIKDLPIITDKDIECLLGERLSKISNGYIEGFGSSDCKCKSHLYYFKENPLKNPKFIEMVTYFRLDFNSP